MARTGPPAGTHRGRPAGIRTGRPAPARTGNRTAARGGRAPARRGTPARRDRPAADRTGPPRKARTGTPAPAGTGNPARPRQFPARQARTARSGGPGRARIRLGDPAHARLPLPRGRAGGYARGADAGRRHPRGCLSYSPFPSELDGAQASPNRMMAYVPYAAIVPSGTVIGPGIRSRRSSGPHLKGRRRREAAPGRVRRPGWARPAALAPPPLWADFLAACAPVSLPGGTGSGLAAVLVAAWVT